MQRTNFLLHGSHPKCTKDTQSGKIQCYRVFLIHKLDAIYTIHSVKEAFELLLLATTYPFLS